MDAPIITPEDFMPAMLAFAASRRPRGESREAAPYAAAPPKPDPQQTIGAFVSQLVTALADKKPEPDPKTLLNLALRGTFSRAEEGQGVFKSNQEAARFLSDLIPDGVLNEMIREKYGVPPELMHMLATLGPHQLAKQMEKVREAPRPSGGTAEPRDQDPQRGKRSRERERDQPAPQGLLAKTKLCDLFRLGIRHNSLTCQFAHGAAELRACPDLRKTSWCKVLLSSGSCPSSNCDFCHSPDEFKNGYSTRRLCRFFVKGNCAKGYRCPFLHPGVNDDVEVDRGEEENEAEDSEFDELARCTPASFTCKEEAGH